MDLAGKTGYLVCNEFHGFERFTASERQVGRLLRQAKPSDCASHTTTHRVEGGKIVGRVHVHKGEIQGVERMQVAVTCERCQTILETQRAEA